MNVAVVDLETPVHFGDRDNIKYDWVRQGGVLPELIVTPMGCRFILDIDEGSNSHNIYNNNDSVKITEVVEN